MLFLLLKSILLIYINFNMRQYDVYMYEETCGKD